MFCPQCKAEYREGFTRCVDCDVELVEEFPSAAIVSQGTVDPGDPDEDPFCSFWSGDDPRVYAELCELLDKERIPHKTVSRADHLFHISKYPAFQLGIPFSQFERAEAVVKDAYGSDDEPQDAARLLPVDGSAVYTGRTVAKEELMASASGPQGSLVMLWAGEDPVLHSSLLEALQSADIPFIDRPTGDERVAPTADIFPIDWKRQFGFEVAVASTSLAAAEEILEKLLDEEPVNMELSANDELPLPVAEVKPTVIGQTTCAVWSGADEEQAGFLSRALKENEIPVRVEKNGSEATLYVPPQEETLAREIIREILEGAPPA